MGFKQMKRKIFALVLASALLLSGCAGEENADELSVQSGVINLQMRTPDTFDVLLTQKESVRDVMLIVYEPLFNVTETFAAEGVLAEECVMGEGALTARVTLKEGVLWHNGDTFNADDVIYTVNKILSNPSSSYYDNVKKIESVTSAGSYELTFKFTEPYSQFKYALYFPIEHQGIDTAQKTVGTGPYMVGTVSDSDMTLYAFGSWHGGAVGSESINVQFLRSTEIARAAFSAGKLSAITMETFDTESFAVKEGMNNTSYPNGVFEFIGFNAESGIFKEPLLRIAVSNAVDRESLGEAFVDSVGSGFPVMMSSAIFSPSYETTIFNQEYAQEVIFSAGWIDSDYDGKPEKVADGTAQNLTFGLIVSNAHAERVKAAYMIESTLEAIGFIVNVESLDSEEYERRIGAGEYDAFLGAVYENVPYDVESVLSADGAVRHTATSAELDEALSAASRAETDEALSAAFSTIQSIYVADQPIAGLVFDSGSVVTQANIEGEIKPYPYSPYANIAKWSKKDMNIR